MRDTFRVYISPDIVGIELGGSIKNVIALAAGMVDGLGLGDNTKAALMTRGLAEISRLGVAMGGASVVGGVTAIANQVAQIHQMSVVPPQAQGNINCGDVITASKKNKFMFYHMRIKPEYMHVIDEYFTMFGYKTNRVAIPNKNHRSVFWYTKTIDVNIVGAIPIKDLQKIKDCYNLGITFWKDKDNFKNYDVDNNII
jgi:hypothetical protein